MALSKIDGTNLITGLPAGSVLQVAQTSLTSEISTTSASYVTSGLTATLTPSSSSNKILILLNGGRISYGDAGGVNKMAVTFYSSIGGATAADILGSNPVTNMSIFTGDPGYTWAHSGSFLYSPSTTSSVAITPYEITLIFLNPELTTILDHTFSTRLSKQLISRNFSTN